jgi:hypothetical protein
MKKSLLLACMLVGLLSFPATVVAKGSYMDPSPPELPPGYVWVKKIWLNDAVDAKAEIMREPATRLDQIVPPTISFVLGGLFTLFAVRLFRPASLLPWTHAEPPSR